MNAIPKFDAAQVQTGEQKSSVREEFDFAVSSLLKGVATGEGLYANPYTNLAPFMYVEDNDDHRWKDGHSANTYYLGKDDRATHDMALADVIFDHVKVENYFDMGPGGKKAVVTISEPTGTKFSAQNWFFFDRSDALSISAASLIREKLGVNTTPVICDFFEKLPIVKANTLVTIPGGTIQNVESHATALSLQKRMTQIFGNYARATSGPEGSESHLIVGFDANENDQEILSCYENAEFGHLVTELVSRAFDTSDFAYHVDLQRKEGVGFLSTGIRAKRQTEVFFDGEKYSIAPDQFIPVLNSNRMPVSFMSRAIKEAGWQHRMTWTATGRSHYQYYTR